MLKYKPGYLWPKARNPKGPEPLRENATMGERVRHKRKTLGWSSWETAHTLGITPPHVFKLELGTHKPGLKLRERIEAWLEEEA